MKLIPLSGNYIFLNILPWLCFLPFFCYFESFRFQAFIEPELNWSYEWLVTLVLSGLWCWSTNDASGTQAKKFNFDNDTSENIFQTPILPKWQIKDYNKRNNFILRTPFWKCLVPIPKMRSKSALQKLNFLIPKAMSKSYTIDCSCECSRTFRHRYP